MKYHITHISQTATQSLTQINTDALVLFVSQHNKVLGSTSSELPKTLSEILTEPHLGKESASALSLLLPSGFKTKNLFLIRVPDIEKTPLTPAQQKELAQRVAGFLAQLRDIKAKRLAWYLNHSNLANFEFAKNIALYVGQQSYKNDFIKQKKRFEKLDSTLTHEFIVPNNNHDSLFKEGLDWGSAIAEGVNHTRYLADLPANHCTPEFLANEAQILANQFKFNHQILKPKDIQKLKMNSFLSVSKGSEVEPRFIVLEYRGGHKQTNPIVLVGKGITFDSGGISLKPPANMDEMKYDMSGAAAVIGTFRTIAKAKLPINVVGLIPACENLPSGKANKPGDVVTSMKGLTIEILNTDAEGRLILCDALTYAEKYQPKYVVDLATLTGAIITSLGHLHSGLFTLHDDKHDTLANTLLSAGKNMVDTCWRMPMDTDYQPLLKSNFADLANIGGPAAGSITAACFLSRFTEKYTWAHLDIAGTAWSSGKDKGATGRPVPLLAEFLRQESLLPITKSPTKILTTKPTLKKKTASLSKSNKTNKKVRSHSPTPQEKMK